MFAYRQAKDIAGTLRAHGRNLSKNAQPGANSRAKADVELALQQLITAIKEGGGVE